MINAEAVACPRCDAEAGEECLRQPRDSVERAQQRDYGEVFFAERPHRERYAAARKGESNADS